MFNFNTSKRGAEPSFNTAAGTAGAAGGSNTAAPAVPQQLPMTNGAGLETGGQEALIRAKAQEIEAQRAEFMKKRPDFDMRAEMENPDFVNYVWKMGLTVEDAYYLVHREDLIREGVQAAINRYILRRDRISENGAGKNSPAAVKKNPKDMSDNEIDSIIERVRNGEKISF